MITTDFVPGSPCWLDLGAPDIDAATAFYRAVFDWDIQPFDPDAGEYSLCRLNGRMVAAIGPLTEEGARPAWTIYFSTPDAEASARAVERLGGTVRAAPFDIEGDGRIGQFSDSQGGQFAVWQPGTFTGLEAVDEPGTLCWVEYHGTDLAAAKKFYGALFGWATTDMPLPGDASATYSMVTPAGLGEERMHGGMMRLSPEELPGGRPYWHPVFEVADCDATVARVTGNGGSVLMAPEDAEGVGRLAVCLDPAGADFVVLTSVRG